MFLNYHNGGLQPGGFEKDQLRLEKTSLVIVQEVYLRRGSFSISQKIGANRVGRWPRTTLKTIALCGHSGRGSTEALAAEARCQGKSKPLTQFFSSL